jgi:hypothetical protein
MTKGLTYSGEEHETALVKAFILPQRQGRYLEFLSKPKRRRDATREFAHFKHLDPRRIIEIFPRLQHTKNILNILRQKGAPDTCYCISESDDLDAKTLSLLDALREIVGRGTGTFRSCVPGRLAYFEDEEQRCIWSDSRLKFPRRFGRG